MTVDRTPDYLTSLINELRRMPKEIEWVEFKVNNGDPNEIGEQISALANSAALCGKAFAYLVWGIDDDSHDIIGTTFSPATTKVGNEELENWLLRLLEPKLHFRFFEINVNGLSVVILEIPRAFRHPARFKNEELIRVGSYTKKLKDFSEKERALWRVFDTTPFELHVAAENVSEDEVLKLLDYPAYFQTLDAPLPENRERILEALKADSLIVKSEINKWNILNLGAILFAKDLNDFKSLKRKTVRVIVYRDNSRNETSKEHEEIRGYAGSFSNLIDSINNLLPSNEVIDEQAQRKNITMYPKLAIRELVANAIIHQDFFISGASPMVEIFQDRIEITNPGVPLIETMRFLDNPPRSRNEALASFMRRLGFCEERGSGIDKVVDQTEQHRLPPPIFETIGESTRTTLFAPQPTKKMSKSDRLLACYLHACLRYVTRDYMTNSSLRERFGIDSKNSAEVSRIIRATLEVGWIHAHDPHEKSKRFTKYVPFWVK